MSAHAILTGAPSPRSVRWPSRLVLAALTLAGLTSCGPTPPPLPTIDPVERPNIQNVTQIVTGYASSFAVTADGTVWSWGENQHGERADGTDTYGLAVANPGAFEVPGADSTKAAAGMHHVLALRRDGTLLAWGDNTYGQVGDGVVEAAKKIVSDPVAVVGLDHITETAGGNLTSLALSDTGEVWSWGDNSHGLLGVDPTILTGARHPIPSKVPGLANVAHLAIHNHAIALLTDGTLMTWGYAGAGILGRDTNPTGPSYDATPAPVPGLDHVMAIDVGAVHSLALRDDGTVWSWGDNSLEQLGRPTSTEAEQATPSAVNGLDHVTAISAGEAFNLALDDQGRVWAWGANTGGQLGNDHHLGEYAGDPTPTIVAGLPTITAIAAGGNHALALAHDGSVWGWGNDGEGQTGAITLIEDHSPHPTPKPIPGIGPTPAEPASRVRPLR